MDMPVETSFYYVVIAARSLGNISQIRSKMLMIDISL